MPDVGEPDFVPGSALLGSTVRAILDHVCAGPAECRAVAIVAEWCDAVDDHACLVICPGCGRRFVADEGDLGELRRWTDADGTGLACGIRWD